MKLVKASTTPWENGPGYRKSKLAHETDLFCPGTLVQLVTMEPGQQVGPHFHHQAVEAFYFLRGKGMFTINGTEVEVSPGDLLICHASEVHTTLAYSGEQLKYIVFKTNWHDGDSTWLPKEV